MKLAIHSESAVIPQCAKNSIIFSNIAQPRIYPVQKMSKELLLSPRECAVLIWQGFLLSFFILFLLFADIKDHLRIVCVIGMGYSHRPVLLIGKFYNRCSRLPSKTVTWLKIQLQKLWHEFCLNKSMHAKADWRFQFWLYLNAVATNVVASHEQDYDAFAARPEWKSLSWPKVKRLAAPKAYAVAVWRLVNKCHAMELAIKG